MSRNHSLLSKKLYDSAYSSRLHRLKEYIKANKINGFIIAELHNIRYLTGFTGSSGLLLITGKDSFFVTDFRYQEQAEKEVKRVEIINMKRGMINTVKRLADKAGINKLGIESSVTYEFFLKLSKENLHLRPLEGIVERMREIKDAVEIEKIMEAVRRAEGAFIDIKPYIRKGIKEKAIGQRLEERLKKRGCGQIPFDIIVASGPNSAMPHAKQTERKIEKGDLVIVDWGGEAEGYFSDMTRTVLINGDNINKKKNIYKIVLEANKRAISCIHPDTKSKKIDGVARDFIKRAGYGRFFGHGTGHGVGLQVHELPRITWTRTMNIKENMIFTIEPGVYIPGFGGVRIEDMVLVTSDGYKILTTLPKKLEIINC
jgi:Xaa-Pro aminopeptidase